MKKKLALLVILWLVFQLVPSIPAKAAATEPYGLNAMLQLGRLPYLKLDTLAGGQSSYDRYGGNNDYGNYASIDANGDKVLLDLQGPGTVYRMWFTGFIPEQGNIKIYFDGETSPRIDMLIRDLVAGTHTPFLAPLVGDEMASSGGYYSYVPLTFSRSIKIVTNQIALYFYYNIGYHLYASDTSITSWTASQDTRTVQNLWSRAGIDPKGDNDTTTTTGSLNLAPGTTQTILDLVGPRSISSIKLRIPGIMPNTQTGAASEILDNLWIQIYWDNESSPSVAAPLGSFFAIGQFGAYPTRSLMAGMDDGGNLYIYFPMPFQTRARVQVVSRRTVETQSISFEIKHIPFGDSFSNVGYFKTNYSSQIRQSEDGKDIVMLDIEGAGHLVGIEASLAGPMDRSFMEGDERIYVDDSQSPAIQGTGVEDFFNGGWYFKRGLFTLPTHGNTFHSPSGGQDRISAYRLFLADAIPFRKHIRVGIEHGNRNLVTMNAWTLAYYYYQPTRRAVQTDLLDVGKISSESNHAYVLTNGTWSGSQGFTYDGVMDAYGSMDDGRSLRGYSRFRMVIDPSNNGVILRRRLDYGVANQKAAVFVDGEYAAIWYEAGSNPNHRWRDDDFLIPTNFTHGKTAITIQLISAAPNVDWTEFLYSVYSLLNPTPAAPIPTMTPIPSPTVSPTRVATITQMPTQTSALATASPSTTPTSSPTAFLTATPLPTITRSAIPTATPTIPACGLPSVVATIPVGTSPKEIAIDPATGRIFVALFEDSSVAVVDTKTNQRIATWSTDSRGHANGIAYANGRLFVTLRDSGSVAILDASTGALIGSTAVGGMPYGVGAGNNRVWVANFAPGSVSVLEATTRNLIATVNVGNYPSMIATDGMRGFVSFYGGGIAVVGGDGTLLNRVAPLDPGVFGIAPNALGNLLYVTNREKRVLWVIDPSLRAIVSTTALTSSPYALILNPASNRLFVVLAGSNQVDVRDGASLNRIALLGVGAQGEQGGDGIAVANGRIYVSNYEEGTVTVIADNCQ
jgi:YVTN family beta-propeller protein